jgi:hypothetical protein
MKTLRTIFMIAAAMGLSSGSSKSDSQDVPEWVLTSAVSCIIDRVGEDYFAVTTGFRRIERLARGLGYYVHFEFSAPGKPWTDRSFSVRVDPGGRCRTSVEWLPDLKNNPTLCAFCVSPDDAKLSARREGLRPGIADWVVREQWSEGRLFWRVENRLYETKSKRPTPYFRMDGSREITLVTGWGGWAFLVDPHTGEVVEKLEYHTIAD